MAIVTLTTDFGTADGYVGAMKGVLLGRAPGTEIVDISHDLPRHDVTAAAHCLASAVPFFPAGTLHVCVVDPGVGSDRKAVIVLDRDQIFIGPDNGVFALVAPRPTVAYEIADTAFRREKPSATFHGRDIFAAAAAELARGGLPEDAGPQVVLRGKLPATRAPIRGENGVLGGNVLHVDVFGNLITNIPGSKAAGAELFRVSGRDIAGLSDTYENVAEGELLAYVGSRRTVEIAVRNGNAAELLGASRGTVVEVHTVSPTPGSSPPPGSAPTSGSAPSS